MQKSYSIELNDLLDRVSFIVFFGGPQQCQCILLHQAQRWQNREVNGALGLPFLGNNMQFRKYKIKVIRTTGYKVKYSL